MTLPISTEQIDRVQKCLDGEASLSSLKSSEELHYLAEHWNWDNGVKTLSEIISRPDCSLGTALLIFWRGLPTEIFYSCANKKDAKKIHEEPMFDLLIKIEKSVTKNHYKDGQISFNPSNDDGTNWAEDRDNTKLKHPIPDIMTKPAEGLRSNKKILF